MRKRVQLQRHLVNVSVPNAVLGNQEFGESIHVAKFAAQDDILEAVAVVQYRAGRGNAQIVMVMLQTGQASRQIALMEIVDVGDCSDTIKGMIR